MGAHQDLVERTIILAVTMMDTLMNRTFNGMIGIGLAAHVISSLLFCEDSMSKSFDHITNGSAEIFRRAVKFFRKDQSCSQLW